ncbi:MAG: hypothetical protein IH614_18725, partial [Desulfuromonadales bacterium]|nr:hypothetical protein [Desulfuromonadales bacterium]
HRLSPLPSVGVLELAEQTADPLCRRFAQTYAGALYQDRRLTGAEIAQLRQLLGQMRKSASRTVARGKR